MAEKEMRNFALRDENGNEFTRVKRPDKRH